MNKPLRTAVVVAGVVAVGLLVWLGAKSKPPVRLTEKGIVFQNGKCTLGMPLLQRRETTLRADVLEIERSFLTFPDASVVVDERIRMPENYSFDKPYEVLLKEIFSARAVKKSAESRKAILYEIVPKEGEPFALMLFYRTKAADLELLYPLSEGLREALYGCFILGKKPQGPTVMNRVESEAEPRLSQWKEELFTLEIIVNKDM